MVLHRLLLTNAALSEVTSRPPCGVLSAYDSLALAHGNVSLPANNSPQLLEVLAELCPPHHSQILHSPHYLDCLLARFAKERLEVPYVAPMEITPPATEKQAGNWRQLSDSLDGVRAMYNRLDIMVVFAARTILTLPTVKQSNSCIAQRATRIVNDLVKLMSTDAEAIPHLYFIYSNHNTHTAWLRKVRTAHRIFSLDHADISTLLLHDRVVQSQQDE